MNINKKQQRMERSLMVLQAAAALPQPPPRATVILPTSSRHDTVKLSTPTLDFMNASSNRAFFEVNGLDPDRRTGLLIFGSATRPGGGWRSGAVAQEEDVSLASSWGIQAEAATPGFYQENKGFGPDSILYARGRYFFDEFGFPISGNQECFFACVAAPNNKIMSVNNSPVEQKIAALSARLLLAFNAWQDDRVSDVIVGAIGCGVFEWDPHHSAEAFSRAIHSSHFSGNVVFAIPNEDFLDVFKTRLEFRSSDQENKPRTAIV